MTVTLNQGAFNEITLRLVLQSDDYGREYFDHHDTVDEMLESIRNLIDLAAQDGGERMVGIAVVPVSEYGSEEGYGFGLEQWPSARGLRNDCLFNPTLQKWNWRNSD